MNKLFSIVLSTFILLQSFGVHYDDLFQLDELIEHAQFHSDQYGDNIVVFLSKHYGELKADHQREHQEEKKDHEKLPFNHSCSVTSVTGMVINSLKTDLNQLEILEYKIPNFHYQAPSSSLHTEGILQPPRFS
ncbi:hypothetical protein [Maribacter sp. ACAM166]|uniref:hypothetical protein n=1 Tax=Maribacter sp. ACAM166 TaxID=2508996 RepID=UPI0010FD2B0F|nr:hypothetical protein [Maribacter sp. ACAM166]TLP77259.1 hypothetical protein ES765_13205 [Maribacter sp. ACAM166]